MQMKKYIVTGGASFIGSHILEYLLQTGNEVTVIDSLRTDFKNNLKGMNIRFF
jgi:nucleoside-diphosphate-sugar epimerase|tara:strand:+ start:1102 stop:1260 length:159 start_codon:yes stop_codon:yes gene_type:complete